MNTTLFIKTFKRNWVLLLIFFAVLTMYMTIMINMFDPESVDELKGMLDLMPADILRAMGFEDIITDLTGFAASWLYGMLMLAFPMIYAIILGNRLVAKKVDDHSFAYLLSTPNSRVRIIVTLGLYGIVSMFVLQMSMFGVGVATSAGLFPGVLDVGAFFRLNLTTALVNTVALMICFFFSCLFNDAGYSVTFGAGVPILFLLFRMLGNASEQADILRKISFYGWFDPIKMVYESGYPPAIYVYMGGIALLFAASVLIFKYKRLPL